MSTADNARIEKLFDVIMRLAAGDYDARAEQGDEGDLLDGLTCGINMLAEEISGQMEERSQLTAQVLEEKENVIRAQASVVRELSTPVIPLLEGILLLPLIGDVETVRARQISERLLEAITRHQAQVVIIDITGVPLVDAEVAGHFIKAISACRLLGARVLLTGVHPANAKNLALIGLDSTKIETRGSLEAGVLAALTITGRRLDTTVAADESAGDIAVASEDSAL